MAALKIIDESGTKRISFTYQDVVKWISGIVAVVSVIVAFSTALLTAGAQANKLQNTIASKADKVVVDSLGRRADADFMSLFAMREVPADLAQLKRDMADVKAIVCEGRNDSACKRR